MTNENIVITVIEALARIDGVDPLELDYTLADYIEPEVLEWIGKTGSKQYELTFPVPGHEVRVHGNGDVLVDDIPSSGEFETVLNGSIPQSISRTGLLNTVESKEISPSLHSRTNDVDLWFLFDESGVYRDIMRRPDSTELLYTGETELLNQMVSDVLPEPAGSRIHENIRRTFKDEKSHSFDYQLPIGKQSRDFSARTTLVEGTIHGPMVLLSVTETTGRVQFNNPLQN